MSVLGLGFLLCLIDFRLVFTVLLFYSFIFNEFRFESQTKKNTCCVRCFL